jgi:hypothetical protein
MIEPIAEGASAANPVPDVRASRRADRAMNILQYGTAVVAIVVVTLLAVAR